MSRVQVFQRGEPGATGEHAVGGARQQVVGGPVVDVVVEPGRQPEGPEHLAAELHQLALPGPPAELAVGRVDLEGHHADPRAR
ncbi:hypothetical protein FDA94_26765 [Herbidospora galbida]|uniref:Uncharacterized protein n=1 Tax=Herbidospora galbida TaxID=2575442 RepID=A0A4U3M9L0_9ACTN|nr:hypothetical protein [Herbidospora galbida]TKK85270.1 hypothetical protein FDA94_26765 [Herbidospora galbida]